MSQSSKAQIEKSQVECLLNYLGCTYEPENAMPPAPDLLIKFPDRKVGVEVTELYRPVDEGARPLQEQEQLHEKIADAAKLLYDAKHLPAVDVHLHIQAYNLKQRAIASLAEKIADFVEKHLPVGTSNILIENTGEECGLPSEVDYLSMIRYEGIVSTSFIPNSTALGPHLESAYLQEIINKKSVKIPSYLKSCAEVWLLMVEKRMGLSSSLFLKADLWKSTYSKNGFEKIFVLEGPKSFRKLICI